MYIRTYQISDEVETLAAVLGVETIIVGDVDGHALWVGPGPDTVLAALGRLARPILRLARQRDVVVEILAPGHQQHRHRVVVEPLVLGIVFKGTVKRD